MSPILYRRTEREWILVGGSDRIRFLQGLWTLDLQQMASHSSSSTGHGFLLNNKGKIVSPGVFLVSPERVIVSVPKGLGQSVMDQMDRYLVADDVHLERLDEFQGARECWGVSRKVSQLSPKVPGALDSLFEAQNEGRLTWIPKQQMGPSHFEVWSQAQGHESIEDLGAQEADTSFWGAKRVEWGVPEWGVDYSVESLPLEFPFHQEISFHKGCYLGQEVIAMGTYRGRPTRFLCRFKSDQPLLTGFVYSADNRDKPVAKITTVAGSQGLGLLRLTALTSSLVLKSEGLELPIRDVEILDSKRVGGVLSKGTSP